MTTFDQKKIKTILGAILALGGLAYNVDWDTLLESHPQIISGVIAILGTYLSSTGPSIKRQRRL